MKRFLAAALLSAAVATCARGQDWGPWTGKDDPPGPAAAGGDVSLAAFADREGAGPAGLPLFLMVRAYQGFLSPVYGGRCPMTPSCSRFCLEAVGKHGPAIGIVMTAGRLMHEADERRLAPIRKDGDRYRFADPVENNDFWFDGR